MDGQFCCETCPDEEDCQLDQLKDICQPHEQKNMLKDSGRLDLNASKQQKKDICLDFNDSKPQTNISDESSVNSQLDTAITNKPRPASLVGVRKLMFESGCELTDDDKVIKNKARKGSLDRFSSDKLKTDAKLDIKSAQLASKPATDSVLVRLGNVRLGKNEANSDFGCENRKSLDVGSEFGCRNQESVVKGVDFGSKNRKSLEIGSGFGSENPKSVEAYDSKAPKSVEIGVDFGSKNRESLELGSDFGSHTSKNVEEDGETPKSPELDAESSFKHTERAVVSDEGETKNVRHDSIPFIDSVEPANIVEEQPDLVSSEDVSQPHLNHEEVVDSDLKLKSVDEKKFDVGIPPVSSKKVEEESNVDVARNDLDTHVGQSTLDVHQDTYVEMKPLTPEPEEVVQEPIYEEISENSSVHKDEGGSDDFGGKVVEMKATAKIEGEVKADDELGVKPLDDSVEREIKPLDGSVERGIKPLDDSVERGVKPLVEPVERGVKPSLSSSKIEEKSFVITPPKRTRKPPVVVEKIQEPEKRISSGSMKEQTDYPVELNPFGDDDEEEEEEKNVPAKKESTSLNPFGSDDEDEEEEEIVPKPVERKKKNSPAPSTNPFGSDDEDEEEESEATSLLQPVPLPRKLKSPPLSPTPKPRSFHSRNSSMSSSIGVPVSPSPRKKKPAPPPPPLTPKQKKTRPPPPPTKKVGPDSRSVSPTPSAISLSSTFSSPDAQEKSYKDASNRQKQSADYIPHKSVYGTWKRKKAPAPLPPIAHRRPVKPMPIKQLRQELQDIEIKQQGLERQGVSLEQTIRDKFDVESSMTPYVEELILQLFELVNEKNELFRRQAELMYLRRQHHLEEEHAELEYQIRCLMLCPEQNKTDSDKEREEELIQRLVDIVERRNEIVQCLEMDRLREAEEDRSVNAQLNTLSAAAMGFDSESSRSTTPDKKGEKKIKKEKKKGKIDIDKDIDESEKERKKRSKKKWFTLPHSPKRL
ncbi:titin isoform X2 [Nilaparvata lugens]|nr:titin isoform X2 [Nilaparvata lugens]XP_039293180.1 titin isoform X2 [Nilaparvata lugens]XP_039293181.1 titin isoform X2 [Nilaparvata lugens]XP_039293182.1 titin isoform X2 [Nilaparvata lugens]